ncbi:hypothetical protein HETIRDRAFT_480661 [Heterobasidion irregulare TC 32-1]|uniref:Uncharacterized protein n=1 Tax=Heterobasidion irregulare (strain TC 32-1) TaxID=747525 RepID=W4JSJ1_HETIT|nr:uncharacterized protein HETIRDRAFT_480661 [Heterobasidion irregulare TC 32-1]ETW76532.1 hypothetical protein HETIRDRAFT_480661 [Heterobasidion irregulare TC 32-1]
MTKTTSTVRGITSRHVLRHKVQVKSTSDLERTAKLGFPPLDSDATDQGLKSMSWPATRIHTLPPHPSPIAPFPYPSGSADART